MSDFYCKHPCDNCPYTSGTESSSAWHTKDLALLCIKYDIPFMCHKTKVTAVIGSIYGHEVKEDYATKVCAGWIRERNN